MAKSKVSKTPVVKKTMKKKSKFDSYKSYVMKVLKQVHPKIRISKKSMMIVNNFVVDTFERIATEASKLCKLSGRHTMASRDIQSAIRLVLPGELSKHAVSEGTKAMTKFSQA